MENILIEIGANTKEFLTGLTEAGDKTQSLGDRLKVVGTAAGVAFAGYTASIMASVYAYGEQEKLGNEVEAMIRATGGAAGVTAKMVQELGNSLSRTTGFTDDQIVSAEKMLLTYGRIGKETFPEATKATLDLAQKMGGDAAGAAAVLGRALQNPEEGVKKLTKAGVIFTQVQLGQIKAMQDAGDMAGAQSLILKQVENQYGGLAESATGGVAQVRELGKAFGQLSQGVGERFAPFVSQAARALKELVQYATDNKGMVDFAAATLFAGAAVSGIATSIVGAIAGYGFLTTALGGATAAMGTFALAARVAAGATGIGLLAFVAYEIYANWEKIWPAMLGVFRTFATTVTSASAGLGRVLQGVFHLNQDDIKQGLAATALAFSVAATAVTAQVTKVFAATPGARATATEAGTELGQAEAKARTLALQAAEERNRRLLKASKDASNEAELLGMRGHIAALSALKKEESAILAKLGDTEYTGNKAALRTHLAEVRAEYQRASQNEIRQLEAFGKLRAGAKFKLTTAEKSAMVASIKTQADAQKDFEINEFNEQVAADNRRLAEAQKFGEAYALINHVMHSEVMEGTKKATGELSQLTQSSSAELKAIGKAAALYQIGVKTIESAQNIYAGFSTIPIIGPALGVAGAAAAVAFGAENAGKVLAMSSGGLVPGMDMGRDTQPVIARPGELMTPPENYEDHIEGQVALRMGRMNKNRGGAQVVEHVIVLKGDASRIFQEQNLRNKAAGTFRG